MTTEDGQSTVQINEELIAYLEDLSCLALSSDEKTRIAGDLEEILGGLARLRELDTENVSERSHPFDRVNAFRDDAVCPSFERASILKNAPKKSEALFIAPKTVE